jgi:DNA polymerase bacteriophage-type
MKKLYLDYETFSTVPIEFGTVPYAEGARPLMLGWAVDDAPAKVWDIEAGEPCPVALYAAIQDPEYWLIFHNVWFDRNIMEHCNPFGYIHIPTSRYYCTEAQALAHNLPRSLAQIGEVFGLAEDKTKSKSGKALVKWFTTPKPDGTFRGMEPADKWQQFKDYCRQDIEAMRNIHKLMPTVNYPFNNEHMERKIWIETQAMNSRGVGVDLALAHSAQQMAARLVAAGADDMADATGGAVGAATEVAKLQAYILERYHIALPNMQAATLERALADDTIPEGAKELIRMRTESAKSSVAKYKKLINAVDSRGRLTGGIVYCGASGTGRDAGQGVQLQNMPRPAEWFDGDEAEELIAQIKDGSLDVLHPKPMAVLSSALRSFIVPSQGKKLVVSDLSNIEGRMVSWLAGEEWKLTYFRDFDAGKIKFDNYVAAYAKSMGAKLEDVTKAQRQVGKCQELSLGYGSGVGGLLQFLGIYRVNVNDLATATESIADKAIWAEVIRKFDWAQKNGYAYDLPLHQWAACEYLKQQWRNAHTNIAQLWADCEAAFRNAYITPDVWFKAGQHLAYKRRGKWIFCKLPSGRVLSYPNPRITEDGITYMSMDQDTRQWARTHIYAGKFVAHATQASARDLLLQSSLKAGNLGYTTVMRVHDELITETPDSPAFNDAGLGAILSTPHDWCKGLPLAAAGYETNVRYRKD